MSCKQFQEQCAVELEKLDCAHRCGVGAEIAQKIRAIPLPEADQWKPIDTAPADGNCLVAVNTDHGFYICRLERDKRGNWIHDGEPTFCKSYFFSPEYWMPLPGSPVVSEGGAT